MAPSIAVILLSGILVGCAGDPSESEFVSLPGTEEVTIGIAGCLADSGWEVEVGEGGSIDAEVPFEQSAAYEEALAACSEQFPIRTFDDLTQGERELLYELQLDAHECLTSQEADLEDPPSLQSFIDDGGLWSPFFEAVEEATFERGNELLSLCPQVNW